MGNASAPRRRRGRSFLLVALVAAIAGATGWAAGRVLSPPDDPTIAASYTFATVEQGQVGSELRLNTVASWKQRPIGVNRASGVVTGVSLEPGSDVNPGSVLYAVDLRPVVVAEGSTPAFREIAFGTKGADVAQAQELLRTLGFLDGASKGLADRETVRAIAAWQSSVGIEATGVIEIGDLIFVPSLPARLALDGEAVAVGKDLAGGEPAILGLPASPDFSVPVTGLQASMIPAGTEVQITSPEGAMWEGVAGEQAVLADSDTVTVALQGADGMPICGEECNQVSFEGESRLASVVVTVPTQAGLVVPSAAIVTGADGDLVVIDDRGTRVPVVQVAAARGLSLIEGISEGSRVRVPAEMSR